MDNQTVMWPNFNVCTNHTTLLYAYNINIQTWGDPSSLWVLPIDWVFVQFWRNTLRMGALRKNLTDEGIAAMDTQTVMWPNFNVCTHHTTLLYACNINIQTWGDPSSLRVLPIDWVFVQFWRTLH